MTASARLALALTLLASLAGPARAGILSVGGYASEWTTGEDRGRTRQVEVRLDLGAVFGIAIAQGDIDLATDVPAEGYATPPDLRLAITITPIPNRYFAPYITLGGGRATYAGDRTILLGGIGAEIELTRWLIFQAEWVALGPTPIDASHAMANSAGGGQEMDLGQMLGEHYNLGTTQARAGFRLTY